MYIHIKKIQKEHLKYEYPQVQAVSETKRVILQWRRESVGKWRTEEKRRKKSKGRAKVDATDRARRHYIQHTSHN